MAGEGPRLDAGDALWAMRGKLSDRFCTVLLPTPSWRSWSSGVLRPRAVERSGLLRLFSGFLGCLLASGSRKSCSRPRSDRSTASRVGCCFLLLAVSGVTAPKGLAVCFSGALTGTSMFMARVALSTSCCLSTRWLEVPRVLSGRCCCCDRREDPNDSFGLLWYIEAGLPAPTAAKLASKSIREKRKSGISIDESVADLEGDGRAKSGGCVGSAGDARAPPPPVIACSPTLDLRRLRKDFMVATAALVGQCNVASRQGRYALSTGAMRNGVCFSWTR